MAEKAYVQTRDGEVIEVPKAQVRSKLESGDYLPATAADKKAADKDAAASTLGAKAKTFAESAAASAIDVAQAPIALPIRAGAALLGKGDPLKDINGRATVENAAALFGGAKNSIAGENQNAEAYGREYGDNARERAEHNSGTATAGNIAGALLAGGALSGGAGAIGSSAASALGGGAAARAAGVAVGGALEGAAYGQAQAGEEAYLHNIPLSGEKLIAAMGWGAVLAGGVSLAAHGAGALLRKGSRGATPLDSPRLPGASDDAALLADDAASLPVDSAEQTPSRFSGALRDFADERTAKALGARGSSLKKLGRTAETAEATMHDMAQTVRGVTLDDGTAVFRPLDSQGELAERVALAKQETGKKLGAFREEADRIFEAHPEIAPKAESIAERIERDIVAPVESHPLSSVRAQAAPIRQLVDDIKALGSRSANDNAKGIGISDLTQLRQGLDDQIYQAKRGVNLTQQGAPPNLKDLERARGILEESIEASSDKAAQFFEKPAAQSYKQIKTQWRHLNLASDIAGAAELQNLGNRVVSPSDYGVGVAAGAMHGGVAGVAAAAAHHVVREHASAVLAVLADKLANTLDNKLESGLGAFFRESTARAQAGVASASNSLSSVPSVPIRRIITPAAVEAFQGRSKSLADAYEKRVGELTNANREAGAGVRASVQGAMGGAYEAMPRLTQAATVTASRGAQYLQSQLPGGVLSPTAFQPNRKSSPSDLEIREFAQKWSAVANPLSVVDDLRRGTVTHAQIDALKAVYPEFYAEVQQKALTKIRELDERGKRMPFNDRLQLDLFLDLNGAGEPTLAGKFVDRITALTAAKAKHDAQPKPHGSGGALAKIGATRQSGAQGTFGG